MMSRSTTTFLVAVLCALTAPALRAQTIGELIRLFALKGEVDGLKLDLMQRKAWIEIAGGRSIAVIRLREDDELELRDGERSLLISLPLAEELEAADFGVLVDLCPPEAGTYRGIYLVGLGVAVALPDGRVSIEEGLFTQGDTGPEIPDEDLQIAAVRFRDALGGADLAPAVLASWQRLLGAFLGESVEGGVDPWLARRLLVGGYRAGLPDALLEDLAALRVSLCWRDCVRLESAEGRRIVILENAVGGLLRREENAGLVTVRREWGTDGAPMTSTAVYDQTSGALVSAETRIGDWVAGRLVAGRYQAGERVPDLDDDRVKRQHLIAERIPPHVLIVDLEGDPVAIVTATGRVEAPGRASPEDFLAGAARALPSIAELDLIRGYFFSYVHDSPDPRVVDLVGFPDLKGEIHQNADQILARAAGGVCLGDCDDLAELYQNITRRQGRLSYVMNLPAHAACGWLRQDGTRWFAELLQTGPAQRFEGASAAEALSRAYGSFGPLAEGFAERLEVLLRFEGDNTRSPWMLGWRIFVEPDYGATMVEIQRCWHMHTYGRAETLVRAMLAAGDDDPANWRELSGILEQARDFAGALEALARAESLGDASDPQLALRRLALLKSAGRLEEFRAILGRRCDEFRVRKDALRTADLMPLLSLLALGVDEPGLMNKVADVIARVMITSRNLAIVNAAASWNGDAALDRVTARLRDDRETNMLTHLMAGLGAQVLREAARRNLPLAAGVRLEKNCEDFIVGGQFRFLEGSDERLAAHAALGWFQATVVGPERYEAMLEATPWPGTGDDLQHDAPRGSGLAQALRDLPWVRCSDYWALASNDVAIDDLLDSATRRARVAHYAPRSRAAFARLRELGLMSPRLLQAEALAELGAGLVLADLDRIAAAIDAVVDMNDRDFRNEASELLAQVGARGDAELFGRALDLWHQKVRYAPSGFGIAWAAAAISSERARQAAEAALRHYPDHADLIAERDYMKGRLGD
ncbi:MAG: hypothetical protein H6807_01155 [Planctomycetes bacterium]|nr:hypothetical protein [Planctomycetota bacterium]